jgi:hypothetical protein
MEDFNNFIRSATDSIICKYLCSISKYSTNDVFKNITKDIAEFKIEGRKNEYILKFIITDIKNYELKCPADVSKVEFDKTLNEMDTIIRSNVVMKSRYEEYLSYQNSKPRVPKVTLIEGGRLFLHECSQLYYLGNSHMEKKHIDFVTLIRYQPQMIGIEISQVKKTK